MPRFATILITLALCAAARGQALADHVPGDGILYVGWHGVDGNIPGYDQSHLQAIVQASQVSKLIHDCVPNMVKKLTGDDPQVGDLAQTVLALEDAMWKNPTAVYLESVVPDPQTDVKVHAAILCQAGQDAAPLAEKISALLDKAAPGTFTCKSDGGIFVLASWDGVDTAPSNALSTNKEFVADLAGMSKTPFSVIYVDGGNMLATVDQFARSDPKINATWHKIETAIGLDGFRSLCSADGFSGKDWLSESILDAPNPRHGFFALSDEAITDDLLNRIPASATTAGAVSFDLGALVQGLLDGVSQIDPDVASAIDQGKQMASSMLGMDVQKDFLNLFGKQWGFYCDPETAGFGSSGMVILNHPADAQALSQSIDKIQGVITALAAQNLAEMHMTVEFHQFTAGSSQVHYLASPLISPAWTVKDGRLCISMFPQPLAAMLEQKPGKSLLENPDYVDLRKRLGGPAKVSGFTFIDLPRAVPLTYQNWVMFSRLLLGAGDLFGLNSPPTVVPTLPKLMDQLDVAGSISWADDGGFHSKSISPFPGAEVLGAEMSSMDSLFQMGMMSGAMGNAFNHQLEVGKTK